MSDKADPGLDPIEAIRTGLPPGVELDEREEAILDLAARQAGDVQAAEVPMADPVAQALARLSQRAEFTGDDDLVICGIVGQHIDPKVLRASYVAARDAADLRSLRFHDLRHVSGTLAINRASALQVKTWMGHADLKTTERYLHYRLRADEAELLTGAFDSGTERGPELPSSERNGEQLTGTNHG